MSKQITIIDYGMSNLLSITRAIEYVDARVVIAQNADDIMKADYLVCPGVGSFYDGMRELEERNMPDAIRAFVKKGNPFLGICLGMQMMLTNGTEIQERAGLNIIEGTVLRLPAFDSNGNRNRVPHVCWNSIHYEGMPGSIFSGVPDNSFFYFVHSYYSMPDGEEDIYATTLFEDFKFASVVNKDNAWGMQFHPEKSGALGLKILSNFTTL